MVPILFTHIPISYFGPVSNKFQKNERLKSLNAFKALFAAGQSVKHFPVRMVFVPWEIEGDATAQVAFSVTKKRFKKAVDRNFIKRQMRESFRLNKHEFLTDLQQTYAVLFIYLHHQNSTYQAIDASIKKCLQDLAKLDADKIKQ